MVSERPYTTFYLVRHGQTEWNKANITMGHADSPLTEEGKEQARKVRELLADVSFDAAYSSDLLRTERTAEIIVGGCNLDIESRKAFRERTYAQFEGRPSSDYKEAVAAFLGDKILSDEEAWVFRVDDEVETDDEITTRAMEELRLIARERPGETVLVVTHAGPLRTFLVKTGFKTRSELPSGSFGNCGYAKVRSDGISFFVDEAVGIKKKEGAE